jgi:hypothetical protein
VSEFSEDVRAYLLVMEQIRRRLDASNRFVRTDGPASLDHPSIESAYLQLRKILELVAFGSLVANKQAFAKVYSKFAKMWHASELLKDLQRINPNFYPRPMVHEAPKSHDSPRHLVDRPMDYLTKEDFVELYGRVGELMHARNPYNTPLDYKAYHTAVDTWGRKIRDLLAVHIIQLIDSQNLWLVHMVDASDGRPHAYTLGPSGPWIRTQAQ